MDNSSIRGRFSLSTTNLTSPIAESTCLNGLSSRSKFNRGEGTISPRSRNNSTTLREKDNSMSKNSNGIPAKVSKSPSSRIDLRTYIDIHSSGLVSRIVKYHDNSARLIRSLSMTNLYNKPGQFPVVHLKTSEQQYKAKKTKNLSMTRIAAPEKSAFHGNTLSSILRSGSIVGLQKSDEEISRENRPILHPPPTANEMAPTRSVLEVLKEISRKRINSDEMTETELTKKQCKESDQDPISNISQRTQSKRQREITNSIASNAQISPEQQVIKKRMCNYNNDIMSSLSSSVNSVNKNKIIEIQSQKRTASEVRDFSASNTSSTDFEPLRSEKQRCMGNLSLQHLTASTKYSPITPLPSTPHQSVNELDSGRRNGIVSRRASEPVLSNTKPKLTLFNKDYDEVPTNVHNDNTERREGGDLCGIQFVKPKKSSSMSSCGSLLMEKTKKSKLALMLSGLKGELGKEDEVDTEIPKEKQQRPVEAPVSVLISSAANITSSTSLLSTTTSVATSTPSETTKSLRKDSQIKLTEVSKGLNLTPVPTNSSTSGAPVLVTTPETAAAIPAIAKNAPISSITLASTPKTAAVGFSFGLSTPNKGQLTTTAALTLQSSTEPQTTTSLATISVPGTALPGATKSFAFGSLTTLGPASTAPGFTVGATTAPSQSMPSTKELSLVNAFGTTSTKITESAPLKFGQSSMAQPTFSFGSLAGENLTSNALTKATASPATTRTLTNNFGSQKNTWNSSATPAPTNTASIVGIGSFGGSVSSSLPQSTTALKSTTSTGGFSFGSSSSTEASKALFGSMTTAKTTSANSNTTFSFSAYKAQANPMTPVNAFTFCAESAPSPAAPVNTALTFGTTAVAPAPMTSVNPQNMFGNTGTNQPPNTFSFGSSGPSTTPQKGAFSFSSSDKTAIAAPTAGSSVGGFSFNNPSASSLPVLDASKNIFGAAAPAAAEIKPAFNFGSTATINQTTDKAPIFGVPANIFGTPATSSTTQGSAFNFGSSSSDTTHQRPTAASANLFGPGPTSNITSGLIAPTGSNSVFGAPSAVAPLQQSSTFTFGASSSNTKKSTAKPTGGFVFGSSSSIGSNASKPAVDMNKAFVFDDDNTTIKPAPSSTTNIFGGSNPTNGGASITGATDNKMFSFGASAGVGNTFATGCQTVNPAPAFNFGAVAPAATAALAPNGNLFAPKGQPQTDRPIRKAMRRLHRT